MALVDDEDYELVSKYSGGASDRRTVYARALSAPSPQRNTCMHRLILNAPAYSGSQEPKRLDCKRDNLRFATNSQNKPMEEIQHPPKAPMDTGGWLAQRNEGMAARVQINERTGFWLFV